MAIHKSKVDLRDEADHSKITHATVITDSGFIGVGVEGYGDYTSVTGEGYPVVIEVFDKEARVVIWGDINSEDPTHIISLRNAKESLRELDDEPAQAGQKEANA